MKRASIKATGLRAICCAAALSVLFSLLFFDCVLAQATDVYDPDAALNFAKSNLSYDSSDPLSTPGCGSWE